jgi:hypothetical protein
MDGLRKPFTHEIRTPGYRHVAHDQRERRIPRNPKPKGPKRRRLYHANPLKIHISKTLSLSLSFFRSDALPWPPPQPCSDRYGAVTSPPHFSPPSDRYCISTCDCVFSFFGLKEFINELNWGPILILIS